MHLGIYKYYIMASQVAQWLKNPPANAGDARLILGSGSSSGEGNGNPSQFSSLENPIDRGAWWAIVHAVTKSQTRLNDEDFHFLTFILICNKFLYIDS